MVVLCQHLVCEAGVEYSVWVCSSFKNDLHYEAYVSIAPFRLMLTNSLCTSLVRWFEKGSLNAQIC
jgi:hypothetical protein